MSNENRCMRFDIIAGMRGEVTEKGENREWKPSALENPPAGKDVISRANKRNPYRKNVRVFGEDEGNERRDEGVREFLFLK